MGDRIAPSTAQFLGGPSERAVDEADPPIHSQAGDWRPTSPCLRYLAAATDFAPAETVAHDSAGGACGQLGPVSATAAVWWQHSVLSLVIAAFAAVLVYPLVWYLLHRFVLHGSFLYKMRWSAAMWKRIHFDH